MRPISVLNVEGRIFFSAVQKRLASFMLSNNYIKIKTQKAFLEGIAGCIEHGSMVFEALRYAKRHGVSICVAWLDLANAYGSVRHNFVQFALKWYHIPPLFAKFFSHITRIFLLIFGEIHGLLSGFGLRSVYRKGVLLRL